MMKRHAAGYWAPFAIAALLTIGANEASAQFDVLWGGSNNGDWWQDSNWPGDPGGLEPLADFGEQALINNGTTAVVSRAANTSIDPDEGNPGGVKLGTGAGTSGGLRIASGGTLTVEAGEYDDGILITTTDGFVDAGQAGTGTLTVQGGGTLNSVGLRSGGDVASSITLGGTTGLTANISTGLAVLARTTRVVGPNVNFSAANGIQLSDDHTLVAQITSQSSHSPLSTPALAILGGTFRPEFSGVTPQAGNAWTILDAGLTFGEFDAIDLSAAPALGTAQAYRLKRVAGGHGTQVQLSVDQLLTLVIDRQTGATSITNEGSTAVAIDGYSVLSPFGALTGNWVSLADQGQLGWHQAASTTNDLNELKQTGSRLVSGSSPASLGTPYRAVFPEFGVDPDDVEFEFTLNGEVIQGLIKYTGTKVNNELAIIVDPNTGEVQFKNDSPFDVSIDAYSIYSTSGSLNASNGNWTSFADAGVTGWEEAAPLPSVVSELNPDGGLLLEAFDNYDFGELFNSGGTQDLVFEYLLQGETTPRQGVVVYSAIPEGVPGDYNGDGTVNQADYTVWRDNLGAAMALRNEGESTTPGQVTVEDYVFWKTQFSAITGGGALTFGNSSVPEPSALSIVALLALVGVTFGCRDYGQLAPLLPSTLRLMNTRPAALLATVLVLATSAQAVTIIDEDFEGLSGLPAGWTLIDNNEGTADPTFTLVAGHDGTGGNSGQAGHIGDMIDGIPGPGQPNGGWFQAPTTVNASSSWQLSFDIKFGFPSEGTADDSAIVFGDLANRNYYTLVTTEASENNDLFYLLDDDRQGNGDGGTAVIGSDEYASGLVENTWYSGNLTYDSNTKGLSFQLLDSASGVRVGSFNTVLNGTHMVINSATSLFETTNPALTGNVQFGFSTLNDNGTFDNILLETISTAPGDVDGDGDADPNDFFIIRDNFRRNAASRGDGDLTGDGFVNFEDYRQWKDTQSGSLELYTLLGVPEPGSVALVVLGVALLGLNACARRNATNRRPDA